MILVCTMSSGLLPLTVGKDYPVVARTQRSWHNDGKLDYHIIDDYGTDRYIPLEVDSKWKFKVKDGITLFSRKFI